MPTIINADTVTGGASITGDTSGQLQLQSAGVTALTTTGANVAVAGALTMGTALSPASGGTGVTTPGASGNVLTSNGTAWTSATPVSGVQQFTSSGSITAGQAVALNSDGTVSTVTGTSTSEGVLAQTIVDANSANYQAMGTFYDPANNWTIFARDLPSAGVLQVSTFRMGSAGTITNYGSSSINYVRARSSINLPVRIICTGTNRYAVLYCYSGGSSYMGLFTVNSTTGAVTSTGSVGISSSQSDPYGYDMDYDPVSDRIIVGNRSASGTVEITARNPTTGAETASTSFSATPGAPNSIALACKTTGGQFLIFFGNSSSYGAARRVGTVNSAGTSITTGSNIQDSAPGGSIWAMAYAPSVDRYIFFRTPSSGQITPDFYNASGTNVGGGYINFSTYMTGIPSKSMVNDTLQVFQAIFSANTSAPALQYGQAAYTASGLGSSSVSGAFPSSPGYSYGAFSPTATTGVYTYCAVSQSNATYTYAVGFSAFSFSSNAQNFAGFATNTVTTGQNTIVAVPGGVATNQTSLTRNTEYYLNFNGSLVTTATPFGVVLRATSTTGGEVIRPVSARRPIALVSISSATSATIPLGATGFRSVELYYSLSLTSSNNPTVRFVTTSGSTVTPTTTGLYSTGSTTISNTSWGTLSPASAFSFTGLYSVDSSVAGGVSQGNYGGLHFSGNIASISNPATQINLSFPVTGSGTVMVYGIPA